MNKRINYIDIAKGICMLLVILHHIEGPLYNANIQRVIMSFMMPSFFLLSGFSFRKYNSFANFALRKINKLIVPFVFFSFITCLLFCIGWAITGKFNNMLQIPKNEIIALKNNDLYLNTPIWFLISLFETSLMFYLVYSICYKFNVKDRYRKLIMALISLSVGAIGYLLGINRIDLPLWIDTSMTAIPFYFFGYFLKEKMDFLSQNNLEKYVPVILFVFGLIVYYYANFVNMRINVYSGSFFSFYLCAICGIIFVLLFSKFVIRVPVISFIGRYSVIILGTHLNLLWILKRYLVYYVTNDWLLSTILFILVTIISIPLCHFFIKFYPKFVGQQDLIKVG
jgi:fucose 4-O-acetylase-like acetyltransferase